MKRLLFFLGAIMLAPLAFSQTTYLVSGPTAGQGPLINNTSTGTTTGWTKIHEDSDYGGASVNSWSDATAIGFPFDFYGTPVDSFCVSKNFLLTFNTSLATTALTANIDTNAAMPFSGLPDSTIAYFWGTFSNGTAPLGSNDDVWTRTFGTAPNRQLWVENFSYEADGQTFCYNYVVLEETTNNIYIVDARNNTTGTGTRTVGVQLDGSTASQHPSSPNIASINGNTTNPWPNVDYYTLNPVLLVPNNASISNIVHPNLPICPGTDSVVVELTNTGSNILDSVMITASINGSLQTPINVTGLSLASFASTTVNIGNITFAAGVTYNFQIFTSLPNGAVDGNPADDTLTVSGVQTGLAGAYTIDAASPTAGTNYQSFNDAAADLDNRGVCGPVTLTVAPSSGPYNEQVTLEEIAGTSAINTVTFKGNLETLTFAPIAADRHLIKLDGAQYVTIDSLTIVGTGTTYGYGVLLTNEADFNTVSNCVIDLTAVTSTSSANSSGILSSGSTTSATTGADNTNWSAFSGNTIQGAYYGIRLNGATGGLDAKGNVVLNNTIQDFYSYGVYLDDNDSTQVIGNDISRPNRTSVTTFNGVYLTAGNRDIDIEKNRIHNTHGNASSLTGSSYAIYFTGCDAPVGQENRAVNNLVYDFNSNGTIYALYNSSSNGAYYYHNSISLDHTAATAGTTRGFYQTTTASNIDVRNNIFSITRGGSGIKHGLYFNSTGSTITSDNNDIYVNSAGSGAQRIGRYGTTEFATLANWQTANSNAYDQNSADSNPLFVSAATGDLTPGGLAINNLGANLGIAEDFFGVARGATPDPGAIEFSGPDNNASISDLINPVAPLCSGTDSIVVELTNLGNNTLNSVTVTASINGSVQTPINLTGLSLLPTASINVNVGNFTFATGTVYDIQVYSSLPNGLIDGNFPDDTLTLNGIETGLSGAYSINSASATGGTNFQSFTDAADALNDRGVCGPTVLTVTPGSGPYNEQLDLNIITGADVVNTVTFKGSLDTLTFAPVTSNRYVVKLDGAQYVTIDSLVIVGTGTTYGYGVLLTNSADYNTVTNCHIDISSVTSTTSANSAGIVSSGSVTTTANGSNSTNWSTFSGNTIVGGYYGVRLNGVTGGLNAKANSVLDNDIRDFYFYGVYLDDTDSTQVIGNDISRANRVSVGTFTGVYLTGGNRSISIEKNEIHNTHDNASSQTGAAYGIYFSGCDAPVGQENVSVNNVIHNFNGNGTIYGIYNSSSNGAYYYHNSVSVDHATATSGTTRGFYQTTTASNIAFQNNVISVTRGGSGTKHGVYFNATGSAITADYNVIYVNSAGSGAQFTGRYGSTDFATFANWQTANSNAFDQNGVGSDPTFISASTGDLTPSSPLINDIGTNLSIADDFFGVARGATPDPGAIEFTPISDDLALIQLLSPNANVCSFSATDSVTIIVQNIGLTTVTSFTGGYVLNSGTPVTQTFSGLNIASGQSDTLTFSTAANLSTGFSHDFDLYVDYTGDLNNANDSINGLNLSITAPLATPYFEDFETLSNEDNSALNNGWFGNQTSDPRWEAEDGATANENSSNTGPFWDHTIEGFAGGIYMFMETSSGVTGQESELVSPCIDLAGLNDPQVSYWYHMFGVDMGDLFLDVSTDAGASWTAIDSLIGEQHLAGDSAWLQHSVDLCSYTGQVVKFQFRGKRGSDFTSDMAIDDFRVFNFAPPSLIAADTACAGDSILLDPGAGFASYLWSTGATTQTIYASVSDTFHVTVGGGCTPLSDSSIITISNPQIALTTTNISCNGLADGTATAAVSGGLTPYTYAWSNSGTTASIGNLAAGTYTITVVDSFTCSSVDSVIVAEPALLVATTTVDNNVSCNGDADGGATVTAAGGTMPYSYLWSNTDTTASTSGQLAGTYTVTVTDTNGCVDSTTVTITEPTALTLSVNGTDVTCAGDNDGSAAANAGGGTSPYAYQWNDLAGQTTMTASALNIGTVSVIVTDSNGCTIEDSVVIGSVNPLPAVSITASADSVCLDSVIVLDAGAGFTAYAWSNSDITQTTTVNATGTYFVTVTDDNGCQNVDSISVTVSGICIGLEELFDNVSVRYYPNPTDGLLNVEVIGLEGEDLNVQVMSIHGQIIHEENQNNLGHQFQRQIDLSNEASGIYFVKLTTRGKSSISRISVQ